MPLRKKSSVSEFGKIGGQKFRAAKDRFEEKRKRKSSEGAKAEKPFPFTFLCFLFRKFFLTVRRAVEEKTRFYTNPFKKKISYEIKVESLVFDALFLTEPRRKPNLERPTFRKGKHFFNSPVLSSLDKSFFFG